jgi:hypothetical protein
MIHAIGQYRAFGLATFALALFGALLATPLFRVQDVACTFVAHDLKTRELKTWGISHQTPSMLPSWSDRMSQPVRNETEVPTCNIPKPSRFDCNLSTEDYHRSNQKKIYGRYASIRRNLDYEYHAHYSRSRQRFQDSIVDSMLENTWIEDQFGQNCSQPTRPWIVFTAGVMGAGKTHVVKELDRSGFFPLHSFVSVDPDYIRHTFLPEFDWYVQQCPEVAGERTRKETGMIAEIMTQAALQKGQNVLVDGSLRDSEWYREYFEELRVQHPNIKIAILHIVAPREIVFERAEVCAICIICLVSKCPQRIQAHTCFPCLLFIIWFVQSRAKITGRVVPRELLERTMTQVPKSISTLQQSVDFVAELHNLETGSVELATEGLDWDIFRNAWTQTCSAMKAKL